MQVLGVDELLYLHASLCYVDCMSLKLVCKQFSVVPLPDFRSRFVRKLEMCSITNPEEFNNKLLETGSVVSGSFILDVLYDTDHHSDIDVYERGNPERYLAYYQETPDNVCPFTKYLLSEGYVEEFYDTKHRCGPPSPVLGNGKLVRKYRETNTDTRHVIQTTPVPNKLSIERHIWSVFDMDLVRNVWDGKTLKICSWNSLIYRRCVMIPTTMLMFTNYLPYRDTALDLVEDRLEKYMSKGFDIQRSPYWDDVHKYLKSKIDNRFYDLLSKVDDGTIDINGHIRRLQGGGTSPDKTERSETLMVDDGTIDINGHIRRLQGSGTSPNKTERSEIMTLMIQMGTDPSELVIHDMVDGRVEVFMRHPVLTSIEGLKQIVITLDQSKV